MVARGAPLSRSHARKQKVHTALLDNGSVQLHWAAVAPEVPVQLPIRLVLFALAGAAPRQGGPHTR